MGKLYIPVFSKGKLSRVYTFDEGGPSMLVMSQLQRNGEYILKFPLRNKQGSGTDNVVSFKPNTLTEAIKKFEDWQKDPGKL